LPKFGKSPATADDTRKTAVPTPKNPVRVTVKPEACPDRWALQGWPPVQKTSDINVVETRALPSPAALLKELPKTEAQAEFIARARSEIHRLIFTDDKRFLLIVGPCSIHDLEAGRDYARRLAALSREVADRIMIVMRVYFE
jgi:hypothetical protein